jgi:hypothetical protein
VTYERPEPYEVFTHPGGRILSIGGKPVGDTQAAMPATREPVATRSAATREPVPSRLPNPLAADGAVALDLAARTATVMPAEPGLAALLWRKGYQALAQDSYRAPAVYAHGLGRSDLARGQPSAGALKFTFPPGDPAWGELIGTPDLRATVVVDRTNKQIMSVRLHGRRKG